MGAASTFRQHRSKPTVAYKGFMLKVLFKKHSFTSLELVEILNSQRADDEPRLRHDHFMRKVERVLGTAQREFSRRDALLMVMSYGTSLQAAILDRLLR